VPVGRERVGRDLAQTLVGQSAARYIELLEGPSG